MRRIVVLDGHDASGKSTLAPLLASSLGGAYAQPFAETLGDLIAWLWGSERFEEANDVAHLAVERALAQGDETTPLVFDRHWLTLFTVLPERLHASWLPLPLTVLCWTDGATTARRLAQRSEPVGDLAQHEHYCRLYRELALVHDVPILDTTALSVQAAVDRLVNHSSVMSRVGVRPAGGR
ncbi:MAG: AAA family ATPase [Actinomycetota bacterium]|nr:AAA family ATPase [Actinomycetota bacterium]